MRIRFLRITAIALLMFGGFATHGDEIDAAIDALSDDRKIGQLLFVGVAGPVDSAELRRNVQAWGVGGVVLYARNIETPEQVRRLTGAIRKHSSGGAQPFVAIDQEGGIVKRLRLGVPVIPSAMALGATRSPNLARRAGAAVGTSLRNLGFTMNFAPVLDVLSVPVNDSIGTRSFGADPALVASLGAAFIAGHHSAGVIAVGKHFPGVGGVAGDTHAQLPELRVSLDVLRARDLIPYRDPALAAIMTGHIALPEITRRENLPATFSPRIMTTLLRHELRFEGVLITDALQMDSLSRERGAAALALDALLAGSDMVLTVGGAKEREQVFDGLRAAYRDGRLPKSRVRDALQRILRAKAMLRHPYDVHETDGIVEEIAARAITKVADEKANVPPIASAGSRVLYVGVDGPLWSHLPPGTFLPIAAGVETIAASLRRAPLCVAAAATQEQFDVIRRAHEAASETPLIFVNLGSPHRILRGAAAITLLTYADDAASQRAAARVILGKAEATGLLPVPIAR
jgi:beta-N-acetylhexosaminidase